MNVDGSGQRRISFSSGRNGTPVWSPRGDMIAFTKQAEGRFDMECTVLEGETSDTVEFTRSGVNGTLVVAADHFDLQAKLGFLLGAFSKTIEGEIEKALDALLQGGQTKAKPAAK